MCVHPPAGHRAVHGVPPCFSSCWQCLPTISLGRAACSCLPMLGSMLSASLLSIVPSSVCCGAWCGPSLGSVAPEPGDTQQAGFTGSGGEPSGGDLVHHASTPGCMMHKAHRDSDPSPLSLTWPQPSSSSFSPPAFFILTLTSSSLHPPSPTFLFTHQAHSILSQTSGLIFLAQAHQFPGPLQSPRGSTAHLCRVITFTMTLESNRFRSRPVHRCTLPSSLSHVSY